MVDETRRSFARSVGWARAVSACALVVALSGCGQKGPLYLPDKGGEVVTRPAGQTQQPSPQRQSPPQRQTPPQQSPQQAPQPGTQQPPQSQSSSDEKKNPPRE